VQPDARAGRVYLPREDLRRFGITADDLVAGRYTPAFVELMTWEAGRARQYYGRAWAALPAAMALVAELMRSSLPAPVKATLLKRWDAVLGLDLDRPTTEEGRLPDGAAELLEARKKARATKDFARSDRLREELAALGVKVIDAADGQHIKR